MDQEREQSDQPKPKGLTRREFLKAAGATALGAAAGLVPPDLGKEAS